MIFARPLKMLHAAEFAACHDGPTSIVTGPWSISIERDTVKGYLEISIPLDGMRETPSQVELAILEKAVNSTMEDDKTGVVRLFVRKAKEKDEAAHKTRS